MFSLRGLAARGQMHTGMISTETEDLVWMPVPSKRKTRVELEITARTKKKKDRRFHEHLLTLHPEGVLEKLLLKGWLLQDQGLEVKRGLRAVVSELTIFVLHLNDWLFCWEAGLVLKYSLVGKTKRGGGGREGARFLEL